MFPIKIYIWRKKSETENIYIFVIHNDPFNKVYMLFIPHGERYKQFRKNNGGIFVFSY